MLLPLLTLALMLEVLLLLEYPGLGLGRFRTAMLAGSPVLPLPVELVAGGEGKPEPKEPLLEPGLGGSGREGSPGGVPFVADDSDEENCGVWACVGSGLEVEFAKTGPLPTKIMDNGRG